MQNPAKDRTIVVNGNFGVDGRYVSDTSEDRKVIESVVPNALNVPDCSVPLSLTIRDSNCVHTKSDHESTLNVDKTKPKRRALPKETLGFAREGGESWGKHESCDRNKCHLGNVCTVIEQNERIIKLLEMLIDRSEGYEHLETLYSRPHGFPLKTLEEFNAFEENPRQSCELKNYLTFVGGRTLREALYHFQKETMSDDLVMHFTWWGLTEGTRGFHSTRLAKVFFDARVRLVLRKVHFIDAVNRMEHTKPKDRSHFQNELSEVFRSAKQRVANRQHRLKPRQRQGLMKTLREDADSAFDQSENKPPPV